MPLDNIDTGLAVNRPDATPANKDKFWYSRDTHELSVSLGTAWAVLADGDTAAGLAAHIADASDAHNASAVSYDPTASGLTATEVQAAIDEVVAGSGGGGAVSWKFSFTPTYVVAPLSGSQKNVLEDEPLFAGGVILTNPSADQSLAVQAVYSSNGLTYTAGAIPDPDEIQSRRQVFMTDGVGYGLDEYTIDPDFSLARRYLPAPSAVTLGLVLAPAEIRTISLFDVVDLLYTSNPGTAEVASLTWSGVSSFSAIGVLI